jgi:subtilisin-like proprotein convertase family protein
MTQPRIGRWAVVMTLGIVMIAADARTLAGGASEAQQAPSGTIDSPSSPGLASGSTVINISSTPINSVIGDNTTSTVLLNTPDSGFHTIVDVNVRVRIDHATVADIDMYLIGPDGTTVQLATDVGGTNDDFGSGATDCTGVFTTFDDESPVFIEAATAPFSGTFRPEGALSALDGKRHSGTWALRIIDDTANGMAGTLYCWELTIRRTAVGKSFFPGDARTELSLWRPSTQFFYSRTLQGQSAFGPNGQLNDIPVTADYTGNGVESGTALFRPSTGRWINAGSATPIEFGLNNDVPVPGDYNGNGIADIAVWRPSDGVWYLRNIGAISWGIAGDIPVPADYDGDGTTDLAVWRPSDGVWYIRNVANVLWGSPGDIPVPADYTGDGKADVAIFRPSIGYWFIVTVDQQQVNVIPWGGNNDIPIPADYDGDGRADIAVFRPSDGYWYLRNIASILWGAAGDIPFTKRPSYPGYPY